jgi:hypothetical protein
MMTFTELGASSVVQSLTPLAESAPDGSLIRSELVPYAVAAQARTLWEESRAQDQVSIVSAGDELYQLQIIIGYWE